MLREPGCNFSECADVVSVMVSFRKVHDFFKNRDLFPVESHSQGSSERNFHMYLLNSFISYSQSGPLSGFDKYLTARKNLLSLPFFEWT